MNFIRIFFVRNIINILENIFYEKKLLKLYKELFIDGSLKEFIDVGVNRGQSIKLIKKINNKVNIIGFEPNPKLFSYLKKKYSKNRNIKLYNLGCSDSEGKRLFYENILDESSGFEKINYDQDLNNIFNENIENKILSSGEEYELILIGPPSKIKNLEDKIDIKIIGRVSDSKEPILEFYKNKKIINLSTEGFDHFG